ncbi:IS30 family transposase [Weissella confusa]|uniref:IS30 family transposase n=1 Tax=Weissella confusa TaxID=1583 RepID=UPI0018F26DA3|nr:IS30 family transposase [Weissella confusa]MBJ7618936.1 IS30 family transposase [Weissella confusa]MBJ7622738.1 IS30 family transposase [Weissella confusa]
MKHFKHLTAADRAVIQRMRSEGNSIQAIADYLGYSRSGIYQEIQRHTETTVYSESFAYTKPYDALRAQDMANKAHYVVGRSTKLTAAKQRQIRKDLEKGMTPEMIANTSKSLRVSVRTIYNWINYFKVPGVSPETHLPMKGRRHFRSLNRKSRKEALQRAKDKEAAELLGKRYWKSIDERPKAINSRKKPFHWEMDGVESRKSNYLVLTFVERKSRFIVAIKTKSKRANDVTRAIESFISMYGGQCHSITHDRGAEFLNNQVSLLLSKYGIKQYVAHAYSAWERGSNENANRRLRKYFPKGTDFKKVTQADLNAATEKMNNWPLKLHSYRTPEHEFTKAKNRQNKPKNK